MAVDRRGAARHLGVMLEPTSITTRGELDAAFEASASRPVVLLKHSARCGASRSALRDLGVFAQAANDPSILFVFLEVLGARELSDEVAVRTGIGHESPQIILLRDGRAAWHASRWRISNTALREALDFPTDPA